MDAALPLRDALRQGAILGALAGAVLLAFTLPQTLRPFAPGELDLVLAARSAAAGVVLPLWAGSVHPEATGSWMASMLLAGPLALGLSDLWALRLAGALHLALAVGATVGLTARLAGRRASWFAGLLLIATPAFVGAHTRYMGTTVEATGIEAALVWGLLGLAAGRRGAVPLGLLLGVGVAFSPHVALAGVLALPLLRRRPRALLGVGLGAILGWLPWRLARDPLGPDAPAFGVLARGPGELLQLLDFGDLAALGAHLPFALHPAAGGLRWAFAGLAAAGLLAILGLAVHAAQRRDPALGVVAAWAALCALPLLLAEDLMGFPAGYRYFVNALPPLAIAGALALGPRVGARGLPVLLALGLWALPSHRAAELDRPAAAFYAGQHRISLPAQRPLHSHFSWLWPTLRVEERGPFAQGYGLHLAREHGPMVPMFEALETGPGARSRELAAAGVRASTWWGATTLVPRGSARRGLAQGLGLGLGEDGRLDGRELELLRAAPDPQATWFGIAAAVAERAYWSGAARPLEIEGGWAAVAGFEPSVDTLRGGLAECLDGRPLEAASLLPPDTPEHLKSAVAAEELPLGRRAFGLRHPFKYAEIGLGGNAARRRAR